MQSQHHQVPIAHNTGGKQLRGREYYVTIENYNNPPKEHPRTRSLFLCCSFLRGGVRLASGQFQAPTPFLDWAFGGGAVPVGPGPRTFSAGSEPTGDPDLRKRKILHAAHHHAVHTYILGGLREHAAKISILQTRVKYVHLRYTMISL